MSETKPELPGDLPADEAAERMIRAEHAGEYGVARIYAGQLAVLGSGPAGAEIRRLQAEEAVYLQTVARRVGERRVRPTALLPLFNVAGFALGAVTAAMGSRAAASCTAAVEDAIDAHRASRAFDEATTIGRGRGDQAGTGLFAAMIRAGCRVAIAASERL